jgi:tetratricopeptide (TPR) repeat protein
MKAFLLASVLACTCLDGSAAQDTSDEVNRRLALQHYRRGQELMVKEQFTGAEREFSQAIARDPLLALAHYGLGQSYMAQRRFAPAIAAFVQCRHTYEQIWGLRQRDSAMADRLLRDEITELRDSIARVRSGEIKNVSPGTLQRMEFRLEDLERMRGTNAFERPHIPAELSLALGSALFRNNQTQDAEREWLAATASNPKLGEAYNNLAALYAMTGRKKEAEDAIRAAEGTRYRVHPQLKEDIRRMQ